MIYSFWCSLTPAVNRRALLAGHAGNLRVPAHHIAGCSLVVLGHSSLEQRIAVVAGIEAEVVGNRPGRSRPVVEDTGYVIEGDTAGCCTGCTDRRGPTL